MSLPANVVTTRVFCLKERRAQEEAQAAVVAREEAEREEQRKQQQLQHKQNRKKMLQSKIGAEPVANTPDVTQLLIRLPDGSRLQRRFKVSQTLQVCNTSQRLKAIAAGQVLSVEWCAEKESVWCVCMCVCGVCVSWLLHYRAKQDVFDYIESQSESLDFSNDSSDDNSSNGYELVTHFPRQSYSETSRTLQQLQLFPQASLFLQERLWREGFHAVCHAVLKPLFIWDVVLVGRLLKTQRWLVFTHKKQPNLFFVVNCTMFVKHQCCYLVCCQTKTSFLIVY